MWMPAQTPRGGAVGSRWVAVKRGPGGVWFGRPEVRRAPVVLVMTTPVQRLSW